MVALDPRKRHTLLLVVQAQLQGQRPHLTNIASEVGADRKQVRQYINEAMELLGTHEQGLAMQLDAAFGPSQGVEELSALVRGPANWIQWWTPMPITKSALSGLGVTELRVLRAAQSGAPQIDIAPALGISHKTVRNTLSAALNKLGVKHLYTLEERFVGRVGSPEIGASALTHTLSLQEAILTGAPPLPIHLPQQR